MKPMEVEFLSPVQDYLALREEIDSAVGRVLNSGRYIQGEEVERFEDSFAAYCGAGHCVSVGNGLDALTLSLLALGVGEGDEVVVPSVTYIATWLAVSRAGAVPVPVEPDLRTCNINPDGIKAVITERTKAVIPVHLYGQPADLDPILALAEQHELFVLEDAAQAHGARYKGHPIGAHGDAVAWSFYPTKNLGAMGDGGAVTTNSGEIADKVRLLGNYGSRKKYHNEVIGMNSRLDPVQAAILNVKLPHLNDWNQRRRDIAGLYFQGLSSAHLELPRVAAWVEPVWHVFAVRHLARDRFQEKLQSAGVGTLIHYPVPPHLQPAYEDLGYHNGDFPVAELISETTLSLPMSPHLTDEQAEYVIQECLRD